MPFKTGKWVKFTGEFPGAHVAKDGKVVGIYQRASDDPLTGSLSPDCIVVVDPKGCNLTVMAGGHQIPVKVTTNQPGLEPILDRADIPAERLKRTPPEWKPSL